MDRLKFARRLCRYNRLVLGAYIARARRMSRKDVTRDRGTGIGSVQETLLHIVRVHEAWTVYILRDDLDGLHRSHDEFARLSKGLTPAKLEAYFHRVFQDIERESRTWTVRDLDRTVRAPWMPGRYTVEDALMQSTLEQAHHLGEIIGALWQEDRASPQMMWIPTLTGKSVSVR